MRKRLLTILFGSLLPLAAIAQIPSGYVQTTATVPLLANGSYGAAWTNLSSSPQLGLLGCVSTFQTTVNGTLDAFGHFSVLLADTSQICPTPSTWTFTLTFACPVGTPASAFQVTVPVVGGGGVEDISSQITAALPPQGCNGGGGGGGTPAAPYQSIQVANLGVNGFLSYLYDKINTNTGNIIAPLISDFVYPSNPFYGSSNTNIATAAAANKVLIVDPSYGITEKPTPTSFIGLQNFEFHDYRAGNEVHFHNDPGLNTNGGWFVSGQFNPAITNACQYITPVNGERACS
jgi:hypothetical protein